MPQKTNLNVSPYFDDYDSNSSYHKVLFKPGYPVQARELTTLQSILQNQIEQFGTHTFTEGSVVIPGALTYRNDLNAVILENNILSINIESYLPYCIGKVVRGQSTGIRARIDSYLSSTVTETGNTTIYVTYLNSDSVTNSQKVFSNSENLIVEEDIFQQEEDGSSPTILLRGGDLLAKTISNNSSAVGSAVYLTKGVYFVRGNFVNVYDDFLVISQYSNIPSVKIGFKVVEGIVNSYEDETLNDNAQGFSNYAAPGADRLRITLSLTSLPIDSTDTGDFIQLKEIRNGVEITSRNSPQYNILSQEFARRTFDESGDYYVKKPTIKVAETLNDLKGNGGIFQENSLTYNNNAPSDELGTYVVSPIKAYIRGYEVETISPTYLDFKKPRDTKLLENQSFNYVTGPTFTLNRVHGSPIIGLTTNYTVSLRDSRVGLASTAAPGKEIGLARVYDFALESGSYSSALPYSNEWDITLFDLQTYTEISVNEPISLTVPTHIKGKSSGATAYLRYSTTNSGILTAYNTQGSFLIGERLIFDGIENTRVSTALTSFSENDVKSLYGVVGTAYTFTADLKQYSGYQIGLANISAASGGVSTVTSTNSVLVGIASLGNLVSFSNPGLSLPTYAKITGLGQNTLTISGVTTVAGVCDGGLPTVTINPSDFTILNSKLQSSVDNTLYTVLPKQNVSDVDLTNSELTIRKQFDVSISGNSTNTITALETETFLPFDEERYVLVNKNGVVEELTPDKFVFTNGSRSLTIKGLSSSGEAKLIATLRKIKVKSKIKFKNKVKTIVVDKSKYEFSGTGTTTINDGLVYGNYPYGTRVQDEDICLLYPDVTKIYGVFESDDTNSPNLPSLQLTSFTGPTSKTGDLILGEELVGNLSQTVAIYSEKINDLQVGFIYLNSSTFIEGEEVTFKESGIKAIVTSVNNGDNNITSNFTFINGQKNTIYDYSKLTRNKNTKEPTSKLKIVFEYAEFLSSDNGDITTVNSYEQFDYCDIPNINGIKNSDLIDIRPKVSNFSISEGSRSPFEFLGRDFNNFNNSAPNILASDESSVINYSFYLPRIDKIYLSKDGIFQIASGTSSETPQPPQPIQDSLEISTVYLPPYLCDMEGIDINISEHKRYRMIDIQSLETRIKNLEFYTALTLLEVDTSSLLITDANGLNRFKSGFFVDDFSTTESQKKVTIVKNSINIKDSELRPTHYTTQLDLILGTNSVIGIGTSADPSADSRFSDDIIGSGVKKTGQLVTLNYEEVVEINQPYSTRVVNVNPYAADFFGGTIEIFPSSDVWVDQVRLQPKTVNAEGNYAQTKIQLTAQGFDAQTGFGPVTWGSWETVWTGESVANSTREVVRGYDIYADEIKVTTKTGTSSRKGTRQVLKEQFDNTSFGDQVLNSQLIPFVRSRNIEFTAKRLKPSTRMYAFFDGVNVNPYVIPKLIEISMVNGIFEVGETVIGTFNVSSPNSPYIKFRVANQNHKYGPYNNPTDIFTLNPYGINQTIPSLYSSTSTILNIDTYSLSNQPQGSFYGYLSENMRLKGQTSGAEAIVTAKRLVTDNVGTLIGSLYIPNPNIDLNPKFQCGTKLLRLTNSDVNSQIMGVSFTTAEEKYFAEGRVNTVQENIIVVRNARVETQTPVESQTASETGPEVIVKSTLIGSIPIPQAYDYYGSGDGGGGRQPYNGVATGYIVATGGYGTVNQNAGNYSPFGNTVLSSPAIGEGGVQRAIAQGYPKSEIVAWAQRTGATVGPVAAQMLGIRAPAPAPAPAPRPAPAPAPRSSPPSGGGGKKSDIKLKKNIQPIDNALNRLLNIKI